MAEDSSPKKNRCNFPPPKKGEPSRRKGIPNKVSGSIREMILMALDKAGGVEYLVKQAQYNPVAFMGLLGRVLPMQVTGDPNAPIQIEIKRVLVGAEEAITGNTYEHGQFITVDNNTDSESIPATVERCTV